MLVDGGSSLHRSAVDGSSALVAHSFRYSRSRRVCVRLTGISVAFSSFILQDVVPAEPRDDLLDLVDVHQVRAVHAPEDGRIEPRLQLVERPVVRRPRVLARYDRDAFVGQRGVDDLFGLDEQEPLADLDRQPLAAALPFGDQLDDLLELRRC